ncbi:hypothetical protein GCM10022236_16150 [Microlunatus ginsengisoli]|uniref:CAAX protease self-immunity n=1 Tax=Microlunatus ginsengisoli TaxID=363863 RepID=A0ABP6ZN06_9ACTN
MGVKPIVPYVAIPVAFCLAVAVWLLVLQFPPARRRLSARWIREQRAPITDELTREVEAARWRQQVGALLGGLLGLIALIPITARFDPADDSSLVVTMLSWLLPIAGVFVGRGVSGLYGAALEIRGPIRVANATAARMSDYVRRAGLGVVRLEVLLVVVAASCALWSSSQLEGTSDRGHPAFAGTTLALVVLSWAAAEVVAHRLVARPLPSADAVSLFWRDALRGERLRDIFSLPAMIGMLSPLTITESLPPSHGSAAAGTTWHVVTALHIATYVLALAAQILLRDQPANRHRKAALRAARAVGQAVG